MLLRTWTRLIECVVHSAMMNVKEREKDLREIENERKSSVVWVAVAGQNCSEVNVIDVNHPGDVLDSFHVCSSRVLCITSVPGQAGTCNIVVRVSVIRVSTTSGNPGNLLEFLWSCVKCRRLTTLVSSHKTGYRIACLRN